MTLNPSRNTLPLTKHTKTIDLDHLKNTQHSLATQHQKYSRFRKEYTCSQYNLKSIQLQSYFTLFENPKLDVNFQILESKLFHNWKTQNCFSHLFWNINNPFIFSKDWSKQLMKERIQLKNIYSRFNIQNKILLGFSKKQSVETTKQPIIWLDS